MSRLCGRRRATWLIEVVVGDDTVELEAKAAGTAAGTVDRDPVGDAGRRGEAGFAATAVADVTGSRPTSGNRGQGPERGAGVDGEERVEVAGEGAGVNGDLTAARRRPRVPDGVAAGVAGVVRLTRLLAGKPVVGAGGERHRAAQLLRSREVIVGWSAFEGEDEAANASARPVDGNPVGGASDGLDLDRAVAAARIADAERPRPRAVVIRGELGERAEARAGVDGEQGVNLAGVSAGGDVGGAARCRGPGKPE